MSKELQQSQPSEMASLAEALEALLQKAYKQNWNDMYPEQVAKAESALDAYYSGESQ